MARRTAAVKTSDRTTRPAGRTSADKAPTDKASKDKASTGKASAVKAATVKTAVVKASAAKATADKGAADKVAAGRASNTASEGLAPVREVSIESIDAHPNQPRRHIDEDALKELARSIEAHGLLQPIVLQRIGNRYQLIAGSRRLAAHARLGRKRVPAVILPDADADTMAMVENLHRRDLTPIEEAEGLAWLKRQRRLTLAQLQALVGKSVSYLSEIIGIANLPAAILDEARAREAAGQPVPRGTLVEISRIKDKVEQAKTWQKVVNSEGGKRDAARAARRPDKKPAGAPGSPLAYVRDVDRFRVSLKTIDLRGKAGVHLRTSLKALRDQIDRVLTED